jgi:large conductance mechanosensitive channel
MSMTTYVQGFLDFIREKGIVALAIGLAIGIQASNTVAAFVQNFIDPLVGVVLGGTDLTGIQTTITRSGNDFVFGWGVILQAIITLLATAFVVYFFVDKAGLAKLDKPEKK